MNDNPELQHAWDFATGTGISIFLTGRAGTGKTTFLRRLQQETTKRMVIVAPTGVAAINAGGMTIHSFFQLPLSPFVPETGKKRFEFSRQKRKLIATIDMLVIDEISMVRSDLLDAIDDVMRRFRDPRRPFGGVQLLMIGDLQQLSPVVTDQDAQLLQGHYSTPFFFGSKALAATRYVTIELHKVYRQKDTHFLDILSAVRTGRPPQSVIDELNTRYDPSFRPSPEEGYIRLTTHNASAQRYNDSELSLLKGPSFTYHADVRDNFPPTSYPTDERLTLKQGTQVMFIKNDPAIEHQFYNGKIGRITYIDQDTIRVHCPEDDTTIDVPQLQWENTRYVLNEETKEIEEHVDGTFTQYPLRLAWAITIHKSQGLTFERAIIDAQLSFAAGQVYVALSRCRTLEGMVLASQLTTHSIHGDERVAAYISHQEEAARQSISQLSLLREEYYRQQLQELFDFTDVERHEQRLDRLIQEYLHRQYSRLADSHRQAQPVIRQRITDVAHRWQQVIATTPAQQFEDEAFLERVCRSARYFLTELTGTIGPLVRLSDVSTDNKSVARRLKQTLEDLRIAYLVRERLLTAMSKTPFTVEGYLNTKRSAILDALDSDSPTAKPKASAKSVKPTVNTDKAEDPDLAARLNRWRAAKAKAIKAPAYVVLQQKALIAIANALPQTPEALLTLPYVGKATVERYGTEILSLIRNYQQE